MAAPSIFISYASQDREAARGLRDALAAIGFDVWYDESELGGGDAWDRKIRQQIRECTHFMPVISASTEARLEGYFRREWRVAVERTQDMADDVTFLIPVVLGSVPQGRARVPEKFLSVQWLSLPESKPTPAFTAWAERLFRGNTEPPALASTGPAARPPPRPARAVSPIPPFPEQQPGRNLHFLFMVLGWAPRAAWAWYRGLRRGWVKALVVVFVLILADRSCSSRPRHEVSVNADSAELQPALALAAQIAKQFGDDNHKAPELLVYNFVSPVGDVATQQLVNGIFTAVYRRCVLTFPHKVGLAPTALVDDPLRLARERQADKMLTGSIEGDGDSRVLEIKITDVDSGTVTYTGRYPLAGANGDAIAQDVAQHLKD